MSYPDPLQPGHPTHSTTTRRDGFGWGDMGLLLALHAAVISMGIGLWPLIPNASFFGSAGWLLVTFASACLFLAAALVFELQQRAARGLLFVGILVRIGGALAGGDLVASGAGGLVSTFLPAALALAAVPLIGPLGRTGGSRVQNLGVDPGGLITVIKVNPA